MGRKLFLLVALLFGQFIPNAFAETQSSDKGCPTHFYLGMAGGLERLNGRRSEGLSEIIAGVTTVTSYTSNFRMLENNGYLSFVGGFLWKFPPLPIYIGPEVYLGRGNARSTVTDSNHVDNLGNNRFYSTDYARKLFYGALMRIAYEFCPKYFASFSLGFDRSQFQIRRYFSLDPLVPATIINRTRTLNGYIIGFGLDKFFKQFVVGLEFKVIQYRRQQITDSITITNAPASSNLAVRPVIYHAGIRLAYKF
jgi:hypothetical protein